MWKCATFVGTVLFLASTQLFAQSIETITVPVTGATVTSSTFLDSGVEYLLQASGTFNIGGPGDGLADAEYFNFSNPPSSLGDFAQGVDIGIAVNGSKPRWGSFSSDHLYTISFIGQDAPIQLSYRDSFFPDNSGTLSLDILAIPEPTTLTMLALGGVTLFRRHRVT